MKDPLAFERWPHIVMDPPRHRSIAMPPYLALLYVVERTMEPTTWLIVTGWDATDAERGS